ncbi:MAG TPA: EAL domain-containing protein [Gallionellaceae bacterium]|nr:EAL domain-containing protein [Gallionellaceae bacterium]
MRTILRRAIPATLADRLARHAPKSLTTRILLLQLVWAFVIYILVIAALWFATNLVIERSVRHQAEGWIAKLDELGIPIYATDNPAQLNEAISYLRNFPEVAQAHYLDETGANVIAEYTRKSGSTSSFAPLNAATIARLGRIDAEQKPMHFENGANSQMRVSAPIWVKSIASDGMIDYSLDKKSQEKIETIGYIDIVLDYSKISMDLNRNLIFASLFIALTMFVATYVGRIMVRWALRPLSDLEEPLTRLANGETDVTVSSSGDREIARIGMALNTTIGALRERDEALRRMANHDGLTGLINRKYFVERLEQELSRIARGGPGAALFFFDLDRFKYINDTYGHAAGDRLLIQIANLLSQRMREHDLVSRFGGDEFTALAYNVDAKGAKEIAESLIALMRDFTFYEGGDALKIHFSIGITVIDDGKPSASDYLKEADTAVHEAKSHGRNCYRFFSREAQHVGDDSGTGWHERLKDVLLKQQEILYYQPMIGLQGQHENIQEVLLRLPDAAQQVINPGAFMPAAERFGLMAELDRQVIQKAAKLLSALHNPRMTLSINLSEQFFAKGDIAEFLDETLKASGITPSQLIFELSELYIARNMEKLQPVVAALTAKGFRFAIDDFGSGFSSFNYIKQFPVHFLKIDSTLIEPVSVDNIARVTVRAIVEIAAEMHMRTIAKCVIDEKSITLLRELGVDFAQGNFIATPAPEPRVDNQ